MEHRRTDSTNPEFISLVALLDADLRIRDGADHAFYAQFNKIDTIKNVIVAYEGNEAVGCGAFKGFSDDTVEIKRMFVPESLRGRGIASGILKSLEHWAKELGYHKTILETGNQQPEAIALYQKSGYKVIPNFGQYAGVENSICFEKSLPDERL
ncbi:MAG: GNAT family N-acetyltransferase [Flavobacterium sp. BFFFF1]|uniref:GNAT family N-acetyltransferase n=1 Tax=unclassified Flavobacterium TaxID=196869 RepID=UPI000BD518B4|nr:MULTISPECIES: GNAT family N-acetyltransferase [unclassified Flavobacterium]OYU80342.1 MAG: GNAT family N-acetyltransferase [Flavobacterium sp. BFFFF1]